MHWIDWVVIALTLLGTFMTIVNVGKVRPVTTALTAAIATFVNIFLIAAILLTHTGRV